MSESNSSESDRLKESSIAYRFLSSTGTNCGVCRRWIPPDQSEWEVIVNESSIDIIHSTCLVLDRRDWELVTPKWIPHRSTN